MSSAESSDMQLLEISRRARKLAQMINSLFKVQNFDGRSKRVPSGVLLEDSLSVTANAKEEEKVEVGRKLGAEEGEQFGSCSWRSCCHEEEEEVKKVIRESLLLSSREDDKASSSRSLRSYIRSGEFGSSFREEEEEEAIEIKNPEKNLRRPQGKMATPNLTARLMGLEELPARETATATATAAAAAATKVKPERESPSVSRDGALERVTLLSIIEREKAAKLDGSSFSDANFCAIAMQKPTWGREEEEQEPLNSSSRLKKDNIEHQPLPQAKKTTATSSAKSSMNHSVTSPGKKLATGVKPAQKINAKLKTSSEKVEGTSKGEDDASVMVMDISPAQSNKDSSRPSNNEHSDKDGKIDCEIRAKTSQFVGASRRPSDSINNRLGNANKRVAGEVKKHLDNSLLEACQLSTIYEATSTNAETTDLYLGCARELLQRRRRYQELLAHHPRFATSSSGRGSSTHDLAGEICKGIRKLIGEYSVVIGHGHGSERDGLYVKLERDLECKDVALNAVWDDGWRAGLGGEAAAEVVGQLEEMVVAELMEEVAWPWG
ncbi:uncharacterized protein LOC121989818 [Zingiber officinale]|uniref:DUF3741 domain-containing protein n=1 Tax=Zingiber officinale TaxID=94328 RepID=A0A8J5G101_ZINOF|nr:uncharacterized protein LOC121989818 [Zingiber officinale]XP_042400028.1 uncharacterized protein LOC121989818 [Zingiber officinale]KAG6498480.1 hypothetical protein ZIOFF_046394 [Zingiber officinale]